MLEFEAVEAFQLGSKQASRSFLYEICGARHDATKSLQLAKNHDAKMSLATVARLGTSTDRHSPRKHQDKASFSVDESVGDRAHH